MIFPRAIDCLHYTRVSSVHQDDRGDAQFVPGYPEIANGWTEDEMPEMRICLHATPMILGGRLRLMLPRVEQITVRHNVAAMRCLLAKIDHHSAAGRIEQICEATRSLLLEKAKMLEFASTGRLRYSTPQEPSARRENNR